MEVQDAERCLDTQLMGVHEVLHTGEDAQWEQEQINKSGCGLRKSDIEQAQS